RHAGLPEAALSAWVGGGSRDSATLPTERSAIPTAFRGAERRSGVIAYTTDRRIRGLRPPKPPVDPWRAHGSLIEEERRPETQVEQALTVFLAGAECPYTCSFCDLWRWTIDGPTPSGALVAQLKEVLDSTSRPVPDRLKLYNA